MLPRLEHITRSHANARQKWWMLCWGLGGVLNRDLPSVANKRCSPLDRKMCDHEIQAPGCSMLYLAKTIIRQLE